VGEEKVQTPNAELAATKVVVSTHNPEAVGSNPTPATRPSNGFQPFGQPQIPINHMLMGFCFFYQKK